MRTTAFVLFSAAAAVAFSVPAAQAATCAELLTAAEVKAAAGPGFEDMGAEDRGDGETLCPWMARGAGFKSIALTFWSGKDAAFFDNVIESAESATGAKREAVPGAGRRAALVRYEDQLTVVIETADGIGRLITNGLTPAQVKAMAAAVAGPPSAAAAIPKQERLEGAAILAHPVGALALRYATALHAKGDVAALSSKAALARRQAMPAGERAESDAYMKKMLPAAAALEAGIRSGGVLLIEGSKATLNVVSSQTAKAADGTVTSSSTTSAVAFELEDGAWKVAR